MPEYKTLIMFNAESSPEQKKLFCTPLETYKNLIFPAQTLISSRSSIQKLKTILRRASRQQRKHALEYIIGKCTYRAIFELSSEIKYDELTNDRLIFILATLSQALYSTPCISTTDRTGSFSIYCTKLKACRYYNNGLKPQNYC